MAGALTLRNSLLAESYIDVIGGIDMSLHPIPALVAPNLGGDSASLLNHATWYLLIALLCVLLACRLAVAAMTPVGPLIKAICAAALAALALVAALVLLTGVVMIDLVR